MMKIEFLLGDGFTEIKQALNTEILNNYITEEYLEYKMLLKIKKAFKFNIPKSVKLEIFFKKEKFDALKKEIEKLKFNKNYIPNEYSFLISNVGSEFEMFFNSEEFNSYLGFLIDRSKFKTKMNTLLLEHKDYSLLNDHEKAITFFEVNFFLSNFKEDFGGYFCYMRDDKELLRVIPSENSLTLVHLQKVNRFIKYINVNSGNKKICFVNCTIR